MRSRRPSSQDEAEDQVQDPEEEKLNALTIEDEAEDQEDEDQDHESPQNEHDGLSEVTIHGGSSGRLSSPGLAGAVVQVFSDFPDEGSSKGSRKGGTSKGDKSSKSEGIVVGLAYNARENCTLDQLKEAASKDSKG